MELAHVLPINNESPAENPIFSEAFLAVDPAYIVERVKQDGFYTLPNALAPGLVERLKQDVATHRFAINKNWVSGVFFETQFYLTHMLACSRAFFELVTSGRVFAVCDGLLGREYRLKAMRYYETYGGHHMRWHTDNKTDKSFAEIPGIIFIAYVEDVEDGEFQYIRGSQKFSGTKAYNDYTDEYIEQNFAKDIVSFKGPKGTLVIYDTYGIHRGKPVKNTSFVRKSLFFQVDANCSSAEPILLNPAFVKNMDARLEQYLGFGLPAEYEVFPSSDLTKLPLSRLSGRLLLRWLSYRAARGVYDRLPAKLKSSMRGWIKKLSKP